MSKMKREYRQKNKSLGPDYFILCKFALLPLQKECKLCLNSGCKLESNQALQLSHSNTFSNMI